MPTTKEEALKILGDFNTHCNRFEFSRVENLSIEEQAKVGKGGDLVIIEKSINPGIKIELVKNNDFVGFLIEKMFASGVKKESFDEPFSGF